MSIFIYHANNSILLYHEIMYLYFLLYEQFNFNVILMYIYIYMSKYMSYIYHIKNKIFVSFDDTIKC